MSNFDVREISNGIKASKDVIGFVTRVKAEEEEEEEEEEDVAEEQVEEMKPEPEVMRWRLLSTTKAGVKSAAR